MNLELIINKDSWKVILLTEYTKKYYMINLYEKKLYICNLDVDIVKRAVWMNHHEEYKENYYG